MAGKQRQTVMSVWRPKPKGNKMKARVQGMLNATPSLSRFSDLPGQVFSSGLNALKPGSIYIVGLNPCDGKVYPSIRDHVSRWELDNFSAFVEQCWSPECWNKDCHGLQKSLRCSHGRGSGPHQIAVQRIVKRALPGADIRSVFATSMPLVLSRFLPDV